MESVLPPKHKKHPPDRRFLGRREKQGRGEAVNASSYYLCLHLKKYPFNFHRSHAFQKPESTETVGIVEIPTFLYTVLPENYVDKVLHLEAS